MATPFTKYLNLQNGNGASKDLLDSYIKNGKDGTFIKMSQALLEINENESLQLLRLLKIQQRSLLESANEEKWMSSSDEETTIPPLPPTEKQTMINKIRSKTKFINETNKLKTNLKQHFKLKNVFEIPEQQTNIQDKTRIKIEAITEMQTQYETKRLDKIPDNVLKQEFKIRRDIIDTKNKIQSLYDNTINSLKNEITNKVILTNFIKSTKRNRHTGRNKRIAQYHIQKLQNEANGLSSDIEHTKDQIESYGLHRNLIVIQNDVMFAQINEKYQKVIDAKVTNYLLSILTSFNVHLKKLSDKLVDFTLKIESNSYQKRIGSKEEIKKGHEVHAKKLDDDREHKLLIKNVMVLFENKITEKEVKKILIKNKYDIKLTIVGINIEKNLSPSSEILNHNNICQSWIKEGNCDDTECLANNKHKIPEKVSKCPKKKKRMAETTVQSSQLQPKKKKRKKSNINIQTEFNFQHSKESQMFQNFFKSTKKSSKSSKRRRSFGMSKLHLNINNNQ